MSSGRTLLSCSLAGNASMIQNTFADNLATTLTFHFGASLPFPPQFPEGIPLIERKTQGQGSQSPSLLHVTCDSSRARPSSRNLSSLLRQSRTLVTTTMTSPPRAQIRTRLSQIPCLKLHDIHAWAPCVLKSTTGTVSFVLCCPQK